MKIGRDIDAEIRDATEEPPGLEIWIVGKRARSRWFIDGIEYGTPLLIEVPAGVAEQTVRDAVLKNLHTMAVQQWAAYKLKQQGLL